MRTLATEENRTPLELGYFRSICAAMFCALQNTSGFLVEDFDSTSKWKRLTATLQEWEWLPSNQAVSRLFSRRTIDGVDFSELTCWLVKEMANPHQLVSFTRLDGQYWHNCRELIVNERHDSGILVPTIPPPLGQIIIGNQGCSEIFAPKVAYDIQRNSFLVF